MEYRREIDGLRALAVMPVIFFHGNLFGMTGGFVGVDIFFVISGYLIKAIILEDIAKGRFSIIYFYERRARRILPALTAVLVCTSVAAYVLMPPDLLKLYSQSLMSVVTFTSNIFFYLTSEYFSTESDEQPLLHTWSLAVEEQFYIFYPILLLFILKGGKNVLIYAVTILLLASLLLSHYLSHIQSVDANFYLIFSRAWELFAGSVIAIVGIKRFPFKNSHAYEFLSIVGILLIIYSIYYFDSQTPFPSFFTLAPVVGASLIIAYCNRNTIVGKILGSRVFVGIGLVSYSLYLWHQPLFAFLRMKTIGEPSQLNFLVLCIVSLVLSVLSYRFVEQPFRNRAYIKRNTAFIFTLASLGFFLTVGALGFVFDGYEKRFTELPYLETMRHSPKRKECHTKGDKYLLPEDACAYFGENVRWATFGDSHIVEPTYALAKMLEKNNIGVHHLSFSACSPSLLFEVKLPGCTKWINEALSYIVNNKEIENILIGFRYTGFLFGDHKTTYPATPNKDPIIHYTKDFRETMYEDSREVYWASFVEIIRRLLNAGKEVYIIYPIPELPIHIKKAASPFSIFGGRMLMLDKTTSVDYYRKRHEFILKKLNRLNYGGKLHAINPLDVFCDDVYCSAVYKGKALYFDDNHLSIEGAKLLLEKSVIGENLGGNTNAKSVTLVEKWGA